ncbi:MAG: glycosyltransferase family 4 protein [Flexilinea flocculi]|nr:glycosyltransferase family 4 protein [Flexilinea flocculi]
MKTHVAIILPYFKTGGAEKMAAMLASNIDLSRFVVTVICLYGKHQNTVFEKNIHSQGIPIIYLNKGLGFSIKAVWKMWRTLNQLKPDVIHSHLAACIYAAPWVLFHPVKMVHTIHNSPQYEGNIYRRIVLWFLFHTNRAIPIALSPQNKLMISQYFHIKELQVKIVRNPVQLNQYHAKKLNHQDQKSIRFINVGRLTRQKNQVFLLNAFKKLHNLYPNISLMIVGDGPEREELEKTVNRLQMRDSVVFTGEVEKIEDYLALADIFVLTSIYEGLPLSVLEAMASGLPIIASDVGGIRDIVEENGMIVPVNDESALIHAMAEQINNSQMREKMGELSHEMSKQYDISIITNEYEAIYLSVSKRKK